MGDWKKDRIGSCERGENPTLMVKMKSGFAVMADNQFLPGYCIFFKISAGCLFGGVNLGREGTVLHRYDTCRRCNYKGMPSP